MIGKLRLQVCALAISAVLGGVAMQSLMAGAPGGAPAGAAPAGAPGGFGGPGGAGGRGPGAPGAPGGAGAPGGFGGGRGRGAPPGPPAPVPAEVAQPNAEQVKAINDQLKKLIASDTSAVKPLLQKYESQFMLPSPRLNVAATYTQTAQRQGARHEGFVTQAKAGNIDLVLLGDSITDGWDDNSGREMFNKYFSQYKVANFAISGDTTQGVLWGLKNGEAQGFQPKAAMIMIGTNNTGSNTAMEIAEGIGAIVQEARTNWPNAKILLLAIFPRNASATDATRIKIGQINAIISKLHDGKNVHYLDIGPKFLTADGTLTADIMPDLLHPNAKGYEIWGEAVKDKLAELMK